MELRLPSGLHHQSPLGKGVVVTVEGPQGGDNIKLTFTKHSGAAAQAVDPFVQIKRLGRGVNVLGYDPIWDDFHKARFKERHFQLIHDAGFQTVRINLHALQRLNADKGYQLSDAWLKTLDWAVTNALANHLIVILDLHNYTDIAKDPVGYKPRFLAYWKQISAHFQDAPNTVWGSAEEKKRVEVDFARVQNWSLRHDRPILLGEFGAYEKGPMKSRALYTPYVARTAESLGWAWTYWLFDSDFIAYDFDKDRWVEPILMALIPQ